MKKIILILILMFVCEAYPQIQQYQRGMAKLTVAGGFTPSDLTPTFQFIYNEDSTIIGARNQVYSATTGGFTFVCFDSSVVEYDVIKTDSSFYCGLDEAGTKNLTWTDAGTNPFDIGLSDFSIEAWIYQPGDGWTGNIFAKGTYGSAAPYWVLQTSLGDGVIKPRIVIANADADSFHYFQLNTQTDSLETGWNHIIYTMDRTGTEYIYVDSVLQSGVEVTGQATLAQFVNLNISNAGAAIIGGDQIGNIATIRLYNYILTPANVKSLYEYGIANGHR